jgi:DNA-binding beta-propeller fold protein YncE
MRTQSSALLSSKRGAPMSLLSNFASAGIGMSILLAAMPLAAAGPAPLTIETKIPLGTVRGRIDHLAVDLRRRRVFIAELGNGSLSAIDLAAGRVAKRVEGLAEPQGLAYLPTTDLLYAASGGDGTLRRYKGEDLSPVGEPLKLGDDADNVRIAAGGDRIVVGYSEQGGALAILDAASARKLAEIPVPVHPESFQLERAGTRAFVNLPKARQVGVVDMAAGKQIGSWSWDEGRDNFPMALDEEAARLFVVYRRPAMLVVFDTQSGTLLAKLPTVGDADDVFVDAKRRRIYITGGEGAVAVIGEAADRRSYRELGRVPTRAGARTGLFVSDLDRLFVAARAQGNAPAALWVLRPVD